MASPSSMSSSARFIRLAGFDDALCRQCATSHVARRRRRRRRRRHVHRKDERQRTHRDRDRDRDARDARDASRAADAADIVVGGDAVCSRVDGAECARRWRACARGRTSEYV
jgi:hypothetical protein